MVDIQYFVDTLPQRIRRRWVAVDMQQSKFPYKTEVALRAHAEHDAIHYLSGHPFTLEGEECVAYLELMFNRGWYAVGEEYNGYLPRECEYDRITSELIDETAEVIYGFYDDYDTYS